MPAPARMRSGWRTTKSGRPAPVPNGTFGQVAATFRACPERIEGLRYLKEIFVNSLDVDKRRLKVVPLGRSASGMT